MNSPTLLGLPLLAWIPLLPALGALLNLTLGRKASRGFVHFVSIAAVTASFGVALYSVVGPLRAALVGTGARFVDGSIYEWISVGDFSIDLALRLDTLSAVMILVVTFIGTLIHIYSTGYMADDKRYAAYFGYLNLFTASMLVLVLGANMPVMFIGWEGVGLCSFLLIGFWFTNDAYATAGRKAFVVNRIGDFAFLLGMFLLYWATRDAAKDLDFEMLKGAAAQARFVEPFWSSDRLASVAAILLFIGACGKSAQIPLYVWLPDAMAGPTPVSALIHAATMVTAGVYMICRLSVLYAASTTAMAVVATIGTLTALAAAFMAFAQTDLKKVLAYSTVSQLGFMFVAAGTGNWVAAIFHLGTHAFFKAGLFLGAGSVMHGMGGSGDITIMGGLKKKMPLTHICFLVYCLAIAGFPLTAGFFSKDEILAGVWGAHPEGWPVWYGKVLWGSLMLAALGTAFYMWRLYFLVFAGPARSETAQHAHESPASMTMPLLALAFFSLVVGFIGLPHLQGIHLPAITHGLSSWLESSVASHWIASAIDGSGKFTAVAGTPLAAHLSDKTTLLLMFGATLVGLVGIGLAWALYGTGRSPIVDGWVAGPLAGAHAASKNKLWVDEIYEFLILQPFRLLARAMYEVVDRFIIDTILVTGSAFVVETFARMVRWVQNGQLHRYMLAVVVGAALVFFWTSRSDEAGISYREVDGMIELRADPGPGLSGSGASLRWDLDGDGKSDVDPATGKEYAAETILVRPGDLGSKVTVWIDSSLHQHRAVTQEIHLANAKATEGN
jgi:NADH-quinone oxidoreductase subunit L